MNTKELRELLAKCHETSTEGDNAFRELGERRIVLARRVIELEECLESMCYKVDAYRRFDYKDPCLILEEIDANAKKLLQEG